MGEQNSLFQSERAIKCKEVESGFDVVNTDDFKDLNNKGLISHIPNKKTNEKIGLTKEEFEIEVKKNYNSNKVMWISNLTDEEGEFELNKVLIRYKFSMNKYGCPHLEFNSCSGSRVTNDYVATPNLISETGYRSEFLSDLDLEYNSVQDLVTAYCIENTKLKPIFTKSEKIVNKENNTLQEQELISQENEQFQKELEEESEEEIEEVKTPEQIQKEKTLELLDKTCRRLRDDCWKIRGYFEEFLYPKKNYYANKLKEMNIETADLKTLKELFDSKAKQYKLYYEKAHFIRWGTTGSEYSEV